jgi:hypothetical protein
VPQGERSVASAPARSSSFSWSRLPPSRPPLRCIGHVPHRRSRQLQHRVWGQPCKSRWIPKGRPRARGRENGCHYHPTSPAPWISTNVVISSDRSPCDMLPTFPQPELRVSDRTAPWRSWLEGCAKLSALSDALASADPVQDQQLLSVAAQQPSQPRAGERCSDADCAARKKPR